MKVLIAIDSFKGSLSSMEAGLAVKEGFCSQNGNIEALVRPLADGGEGTTETLLSSLGGERMTLTVTGPETTPVEAYYGILPSGTVVMEMATASGITLVPEERRNPLKMTTFGVGEMIRDALCRGCRRFLIGIGGSATNDGGVGMLSALGFRFLDEKGNPIPLGAEGLFSLFRIETDEVLPQVYEAEFLIACDVTNPLCGKSGCSAVFGPQKGATEEMIPVMDRALSNLALLAKSIFPETDADFPGSGAAGGLGFAFRTFLKGELQSGIETVLAEIGLEQQIAESDLVITGEGKLDAQTAMGKAPIGVANLAKKYGKKVIAFAGCVASDAQELNRHGIDAFFSIQPGALSLQEAMDRDNAYRNLRNTASQVCRLIG